MEETQGLEAPELYRRWAAIVGISAILQQRTWMLVKDSILYPNLYAFLVGPPGIGKSQTISAIGKYLRDLEGFHIAPTSTTGASLIDALDSAKVNYATGIREEDHFNFNSMLVMPDELSALMHEYDRALVATLTTFYDVLPYSQTRRVGKVEIRIANPQLSVLAGTTTSHLLKTLPEGAWDQGLMSRTLLIFSNDRPLQDDIFVSNSTHSKDLSHDLNCIFSLQGQFSITDAYRVAYNDWRKSGCKPVPTHPRLLHYCSRRGAHLLKLSMVASVDRGDSLAIDKPEFDRALGWLSAAELAMPNVFESATSTDSRAIDELLHFVKINGIASETQIVRFASERMQISTIARALELMVSSRMLVCVGTKEGVNFYRCV